MIKFFGKIAIMILLVVTGAFTISFFYEIAQMDVAHMKLKTAIRLAANDSLSQFQSYYAYDNDYFDQYSADDYVDYIASVESQARAAGLNAGNSDIFEITSFLRQNSHSATKEQFNPLQFDWTFLDQRGLATIYDRCMRKLVDYNLGKLSLTSKDGFEIAEVLSTDVEIEGPKLIDLRGVGQGTDFSQIFGTSQREETLNNINNNDKFDTMYNYVIAYDCTFKLNWRYHTRMPFYENINFTMPTMTLYHRYILTN